MLFWSIVLLIVALIAGYFGFGGVENTATHIAKILFFIFVIGFIIALLAALLASK